MVCLEDLVSSTHIYRKFLNLWNLDSVRFELERFIAESASAKWFCQFGLVDKTPDHFVFGRATSSILQFTNDGRPQA